MGLIIRSYILLFHAVQQEHATEFQSGNENRSDVCMRLLVVLFVIAETGNNPHDTSIHGGTCNFKKRERKRYLFTDMKLSPGYK